MTPTIPAKLAFLSQPEPDKLVLIVQTEGKQGAVENRQFAITRGMLRNIVVDGLAMLVGRNA